MNPNSDRNVGSGNTVTDIMLRPYQAKALAQILACRDRGLRRVLTIMPTGTGKTTLFSALVGKIHEEMGRPSLVLAHRRELLEQAQKRIQTQNRALQVLLDSERKIGDPFDVVVGSVQSLGRKGTVRMDDLKEEGIGVGCLIIDEAHHAAADTYQNVMRGIGSYEGDCFTVGVTATPHRMDNRPLHGEEEAIFEEVAFTYTLRDAIQDGWLADLKGYRIATGVDLSKVRVVHGDYSAKQLQDAVNTESRNRTAFENWVQKAKDRKTIVFCTGVEHAKTVAELFRQEGFKAESVDGSMSSDERARIMQRFSMGITQVLTNVEIATEGFDVPDVSCVLLLRPTKSWALFCQMIGRGLRVLPNTIEGLPDASARREQIFKSAKPDCVVIDVVDNGKRAKMPTEDPDEQPSLAAVVGLPQDLDLEGHTLLEAMQKWEQVDPRAKAVLFRRNINFDELDQTLTAVDMLAELTPPDEVISSSRNAWMKIGMGKYLLACGSSKTEAHRMAMIEEDALGFFHLSLSSESRQPQDFPLSRDLPEAFRIADSRIKETWPFIAGFTTASNRWRQGSVTPQQKEELKTLGVEDAVLAMLDNAGQAWTLLELKRKERHRPEVRLA